MKFAKIIVRSARLHVALLLAVLLCGPAAAQSPPPAPAPAPGAGVATPPQAPEPVPSPARANEAEPAPGASVAALLPRDLSPWGMFLSADIVVKVVMVGLAFASFVTWTIALAKSLEILAAKHRLRRDLALLARTPSLAEAARKF